MEKQRVSMGTQSSAPAPAYKDFADFNSRITKLKLDSSWSINVNDTHTEIRQFTKAADGKEYVLPYIEIFVNPDLSYVVRCFGWVLPKDNIIYRLNSTFRDMTLTNFISKLKNYHPCSGLNLFEFREAIHLKHHTVPKNFNYLLNTFLRGVSIRMMLKIISDDREQLAEERTILIFVTLCMQII